jgi:DNA-binding HxlR family transcriptional regulator
MKQKPATPRRSGCPINALLETLGDTWSLLIVRDLMFFGRTSYNDFLSAGEGIATNILSDRLQKLEAAHIIEKRRDANDARKFIYRLTAKGMDLAPMLIEMVLWSAHHEQTDAPAEVVAAMAADRAGFIANLQENWKKTGREQG